MSKDLTETTSSSSSSSSIGAAAGGGGRRGETSHYRTRIFQLDSRKFVYTDSSYDPLHVAIVRNDEATVDKLLMDTVDRSSTTSSGDTYLHLAALGSLSIFEKIFLNLYRRGDGINTINSKKETALYKLLHQKPSLSSEEREIVKILFSRGADQNIVPPNSKYPLVIAVDNNDAELVQLLLNGVRREYDISTDYKNKALFKASSKSFPIAKLLLFSGANPDVKLEIYGKEYFALERAIIAHNWEVAKILITSGADVRRSDYVKLLVQQNTNDSNIQSQVLDLLIRKGARVDSSDFVQSLENGCGLEVVGKFLDHGIHKFIPTSLIKSLDILNRIIDTNLDILRSTDGVIKVDSAENIEILRRLIEIEANIHCDGTFSTIHSAVRDGKIDLLRELLDNGVDIETSYYRIKPLHTAVSEDKLEIVKLLIERGANIEARDDAQKTPLFFARKPYLIKELLAHGADISAKDKYGKTPLHVCSDSESISLLIEAGANIEATDTKGRTPLYYRNAIEPIKVLLAHGANVNVRDNFGNTPLMHLFYEYFDDWPMDNIRFEIARELISAQADITAKNSVGKTAFDYAKSFLMDNSISLIQNSMKGKLIFNDFVEILGMLEPRSSASSAASSVGLSLLQEQLMSIDSPEKDTKLETPSDMQYLVSSFKSMRFDATDRRERVHYLKDSFGNTPLLHVIFKSADSYQKILSFIKVGADPNTKGYLGFTPLHIAVAQNPDCCVLLLENGADPNIQNDLGQTPLHLATTPHSQVDIEKLLQFGANPSIRCILGLTPLHYAANSSISDIEIMVRAGANINEQDSDGRTVLHHCLTTSGYSLSDIKKQVKNLIKLGANPRITDNFGKTPLEYFELRRFEESDELIDDIRDLLESVEIVTMTEELDSRDDVDPAESSSASSAAAGGGATSIEDIVLVRASEEDPSHLSEIALAGEITDHP